MRILFTGGAGKAGRHVVPYLMAQGHRVLNVDKVPLEHDGVSNRIADITDAGEMMDVMTSYAGFDELVPGTGMRPFDAVVHFAAVPRILITPDNTCYRTNVMGTYNVIDAALRAGVRKIVYASSVTAYGVCFWDGEKKPKYLPVDEEHPTVPMDSYGMSKVVNETTARSFQARSGADIYGLRINNVVEPHEYEEIFPIYMEDPTLRLRDFFAYIDARDLGQCVERCLQTDGLGHAVFNVSSDDHSVNLPTSALLEKYYPGVPLRKEIGETETLHSNAKAKRLLGYAPRHSWRDVLG